MGRAIAVIACLLPCLFLGASENKPPFFEASDDKPNSYPSFGYDVARVHEIKPHRRSIPTEGVEHGFNQLHLTLIVSPTGDVTDAGANGDRKVLKFWPQLQNEVRLWRFTPFEKDGKADTARIEEYIDLVPPERLPKNHVTAPVVRPDSKVAITLERSGCFGSCPSYSVKVGADGIEFDGHADVAAPGKHFDHVDADEVRSLARKFAAADFYSMDSSYTASVTDSPGYSLLISIDGKTKQVADYVGAWVGMPGVISELEDEVDQLGRTQQWIAAGKGLVPALRSEKFNFQTFEAQGILKQAAARGETETVRALLEAGVPLDLMPAPKVKETRSYYSFEPVGWLSSASRYPETLQVLLDTGASKNDQRDKDMALVGAAGSGKLESVRALISYGANPNVNLSKLVPPEDDDETTTPGKAAGSVLIDAAGSGNPEVVREILRYHPKLEKRGAGGRTAVFSAGEYRDGDAEGARVECIRLLALAGANINARDDEGNTALHKTFLTDVEEELLKLGADVNARNKDGETPIFTTFDDDAIPLFIEHGADFTIRNKSGQTVMEAAREKGPARQEALRQAIQVLNQR